MYEQAVMSTKVLVLDDSVIYADAVGKILSPESDMHVHNSHTGLGEGLRAARKLHPDVIVLSGDTPGAASVIESLDDALPDVPIIVVFAGQEPEVARECVIAGAQLCLYGLEDREELVGAIRRLVARERRRRSHIVARVTGSEKKLARVVAFHSAKGGAGTSTVLVNAALALRKLTNKRVVVVDAALQSSDVGVLLDLDHSANIADLIPHLKELDWDLVQEIMVTHSSGVQVLLAPTQLERSELVTADHFNKILAVLRNNADYVLVDTPPALEAVAMTALDSADHIVLVSTPEVAALRNTARFIQLATKLGYPAEKLFLLINRSNSKGAVRMEDIREHLKHPIGMQVRSAGRAMVTAGNKGTPAALSSGRFGLPQSFRQLAMLLESGERTDKRDKRALKASWLKKGRAEARGKGAERTISHNV
jgi:pilus assembly protein CpaE